MIKKTERMRKKANPSVSSTQPRPPFSDFLKTVTCYYITTSTFRCILFVYFIIFIIVRFLHLCVSWKKERILSLVQAEFLLCSTSSDTLEVIHQDIKKLIIEKE